MKRFFLFAFMAMVSTFAMATEGVGEKENLQSSSNAKPRKVYYVVMGSYATLAEAKQYNYSCPDGLEANIYKAVVNGKTVYRACVGCYYSKKKAQELVKSIKECFTDQVWIWTSNGQAQCVYQTIGPSGEPIPIKPE